MANQKHDYSKLGEIEEFNRVKNPVSPTTNANVSYLMKQIRRTRRLNRVVINKDGSIEPKINVRRHK